MARSLFGYFSDVFTEVKLVLSVLPMPLTAARITMLMPTAIRQYSMAVAPDSSHKNFESNFRIIEKLLSHASGILPTQCCRQNLDFNGYPRVEEQPQRLVKPIHTPLFSRQY